MDDVGRASALVLALVFLAAAIGKAVRPQATRASFAGLGLPAPAALAVAVPMVEAALAVALVAAPAPAAVAAAVLLVLFTGVLLRALVRGTAAPCACFGSARQEPVSGIELVRNSLLLALAVVATGAPSAGWPALPAIVVVSTCAALGRVLLGVLDLRRRTGTAWPGVPS